MKKAFIVIIFLLTGILIWGQTDNNLQDGYQVFKYPNGTISSEGMFRNGKPEGFWKNYYVTGLKKRKENIQIFNSTAFGYSLTRQEIRLKR